MGGPGTGKSVLALEFLYRGAIAVHPGIFVAFKERASAVRRNALTLGWDLKTLEKGDKLAIIDANLNLEAVVAAHLAFLRGSPLGRN